MSDFFKDVKNSLRVLISIEAILKVNSKEKHFGFVGREKKRHSFDFAVLYQ